MTNQDPPAPASRRALKIAARAIPALLLLGWSFHLALPEGGDVGESWRALSSSVDSTGPVALAWISLAFGVFGVSLAAAAWRYQLLLGAAGLTQAFASVFRAVLVATFFNTMLPGGVVGDIWRVYDVHGETGRGSSALGVVALERILGLQALGFVTVLAAPFVPFDEMGGGMGGVLVSVGAACAFGPLLLLHPLPARLARRAVGALPLRGVRIRDALLQALDALGQAASHAPLVRRAAALSLLCQCLPVVAVYLLARPLASDVAAPWFAVVVPIVTLLGMLPISVGGTGVREVLYVTLFGAVGMSGPAALALSLLTLAVNLIWAGVGFAFFVARRGPSGGGR